jgi:hypothetical protein
LGFHLQHYGAFFSRTETYLYLGDYERARAEVDEIWVGMSRSHILRWQILNVMAHFLRGRAALACWLSDTADASLRKEIVICIDELQRSSCRWSEPTSATLRAGLMLGKGDIVKSIMLLTSAYQGFDQIGLHAFAAAARHRCGLLQGGYEGKQLQQEGTAFFDTQGVRDCHSMLRMLLPGNWHSCAAVEPAVFS